MSLPIKLISTDFDGTIFAEFEKPPIPDKLVRLMGELQSRGAKWVINTGRDMSSLMEALARAQIPIRPDYLVLVEREIHFHEDSRYVGLGDWNQQCTRLHEELFARVRQDLPRLTQWINDRFDATVYEDPYSPFCLLAGNNGDADVIHKHLEAYCRKVPQLTVVRNDVYARFSHKAYNKGKALAEIARHLAVEEEQIFVAGDHLNDISMLSRDYARWLAAPANAITPVRAHVRRQNGFISRMPHGHGVVDCLERCLEHAQAEIMRSADEMKPPYA
jgi:HAD superfamily hydrolase (TIGR01484 family)